MFRLWGKIYKENRLLNDTVISDETNDTRTHKIFHALDAICQEFDLSKPIWLDSTIAEFKSIAMNPKDSDELIEKITESYRLYEENDDIIELEDGSYE